MVEFLHNEDGATAIEYGVICALIVLACVTALSLLGGGSNGLWTRVNDNVSAAL